MGMGWGCGTRRNLVEKPEGRMYYVIPSRKWKACIKMNVKEMGSNDMSWFIGIKKGNIAGYLGAQ
jgi:hypothetical protein